MSEPPPVTRSNAFNQALIEHFRANAGQITEGPYTGMPLLLLTTLGARSGNALVKPLAYTRDAEDYVVLASKSGAPSDPDWFRNLTAHPLVTVEVGREQFRAQAVVVQGAAERDKLFAAHAAAFPVFLNYQQRTSRRIPVIVLKRVG
jgi:deazaflavin-dependent oxidoreductase (nitroreductase family)